LITSTATLINSRVVTLINSMVATLIAALNHRLCSFKQLTAAVNHKVKMGHNNIYYIV